MKKHEIVLQEWHYTCGDRCCDDYGLDLIINGTLIDRYFPYDVEYIKDMLKAFGITEYELEVIHANSQYDYDYNYLWETLEYEEEDEEDD